MRIMLAGLLAAASLVTTAPAMAGVFGAAHDEGIAAYERGDYEGARDALLEAATKTDPEAYYYLGKLYQQGLGGLPRKEDNAFRLFRAAANMGHAPSCMEVAQAYENGAGVGKNATLALSWYEKAAKLGVLKAQVSLADAYASGSWVMQDSNLARYWYDQAASNGSTYAKRQLEAMNAKVGPNEVATMKSGTLATQKN